MLVRCSREGTVTDMKKWMSLALLSAILLTLLGCGAAPEPEQPETQPVETTQAKPETQPETTAATTEPLPEEGYLFLTVSELVFSIVGEQEDIYVGSLPREEVTWESSDETVVTVENGVLTAAGVGSAEITAAYADQTVSCKVSCLAQDAQALAELDSDILRTPKRMPFIVDTWPHEFYEDAAFVGDSITYTLWHTAGKEPENLGSSLFLVRGGTSINGFVRSYKNIYYRGVEMKLPDAVQASGVKKVFFMLGQNDLGYMSIEDTMANWTKLLEAIREKSPEVEIYIQSLVPEWLDDKANNSKNVKIDEYNQVLKTYCEENGYYFIEIAAYIEDHLNKMATVYSMDYSIHINYDGTDVWMEALKAYARLRQLEGEYQ